MPAVAPFPRCQHQSCNGQLVLVSVLPRPLDPSGAGFTAACLLCGRSPHGAQIATPYHQYQAAMDARRARRHHHRVLAPAATSGG